MRYLRAADQFIHTGLDRADEAHKEAHLLLEKWEKFALKLDHRRKLLTIVCSFYKQTEQASERLKQIQHDIELEEEKIRLLKSSTSSSTSRKDSLTSSNEELASKQVDLSNELAEISGQSMRSAKIILEKVTSSTTNSSQNDQSSQHVIKKVHEFTQHVNDLRNKLVSYFHTISLNGLSV
jgi:hypothetical protein